MNQRAECRFSEVISLSHLDITFPLDFNGNSAFFDHVECIGLMFFLKKHLAIIIFVENRIVDQRFSLIIGHVIKKMYFGEHLIDIFQMQLHRFLDEFVYELLSDRVKNSLFVAYPDGF